MNELTESTNGKLTAYKGFDKDMKCRGFQFEVGKTYEEQTAKLCEAGFHACEAPLDVLKYYPPVDENAQPNRFCVVEMDDVSPQRDDDTKRVSRKMTVGAEIGIPGLVKAHVEWVKEETEDCKEIAKNAAQIGSSGYAAKIGSSGRYAQIGSSGDAAQISIEADHAVVSCAGKRARIKGPVGTWITLAEYGDYDGEGYPCVCVKSAQIDGEKLKADTWYTLRNGEFVEVDDED